MLNKDSFKIDAFFKMYKNHRIILIGGPSASGKTSLLNEIKKFYTTLNIHNLDYSFDPYCKSEQRHLRGFEKESVVLYADDLFLDQHDIKFSDRLNKRKAMSHHCLQTSYLPQVHKIFLTTQLQNIRESRFELDDTRPEKEYYITSQEILHFADLALKISRKDEKIILKVDKDRMSSYRQGHLTTNFFKMLANSYNIKNDNFNKTWAFKKFLNCDFSTAEVETFKQLFGYK